MNDGQWLSEGEEDPVWMDAAEQEHGSKYSRRSSLNTVDSVLDDAWLTPEETDEDQPVNVMRDLVVAELQQMTEKV